MYPSPHTRSGLVGLLLSITAALPALGQVSLAPTALFVHDRTNVNELFVTNESDTPQEVNIRFTFGYPVSDSSGTITMRFDQADVLASSGLDNHLRVFPRRFILGPRQSQTVRVQVLPMPNRSDGMYWTRAIIASNALTSDVAADSAEAIGTRINYILEQSIPVFYRKGANTTGVDLTDVTYDVNGGRMSILLEMDRTGNSPYMGSMHARLLNRSGTELASTFRPAYLYFKEWRGLDMDVSTVPPGEYTLEIRFETERRDMSPTDIVQAPTRTHTLTVTL